MHDCQQFLQDKWFNTKERTQTLGFESGVLKYHLFYFNKVGKVYSFPPNYSPCEYVDED